MEKPHVMPFPALHRSAATSRRFPAVAVARRATPPIRPPWVVTTSLCDVSSTVRPIRASRARYAGQAGPWLQSVHRRVRAKRHSFFLVLLVLASPTYAADSLDSLLAEGLDNHPSLIAAAARADAAATGPTLAAALENPILTFESEAESAMESSIEIEQELPGPGKRRLRRAVAEGERTAMQWELEELRQEFTFDIKESYYQLHAVREALTAIRQQEKVLADMEQLAQQRYSVTTSEQGDALKAAAERTMLAQRRLMMEQDESEWETRLNERLGRSRILPVATVEGKPPLIKALSMGKMNDWVFAHNPGLKKAEALHAQSGAIATLARRDATPDWMLGARYEESDETEGTTMIMLGVDLPIWRTRNKAMRDEGRFEAAAAEADLEALRVKLAAEVQSIGLCCTRIQDAVHLYLTDLIPKAEQQFEVTRSSYANGMADFLDLLEAQRFLLEARVMQAMAEGDLNVEIARLESVLGAPLSVALPSETP